MAVKAKRKISPKKAGIERWVRQFTLLKLGYFTWLNIMKDRKIKSGGRAFLQGPIVRSSTWNQSMKSVSEAIRPAAAGIGKPLKSFSGLSELAAATQLKRARRRVPQRRKKKAI